MAAWHDIPFATNQNGFGGLDAQLLISGEFYVKLISQLLAWQSENIYSYGGRGPEVRERRMRHVPAILRPDRWLHPVSTVQVGDWPTATLGRAL
jgi:hypothetical protein